MTIAMPLTVCDSTRSMSLALLVRFRSAGAARRSAMSLAERPRVERVEEIDVGGRSVQDRERRTAGDDRLGDGVPLVRVHSVLELEPATGREE